MSKSRKTAKCPRCLPDVAGAYFYAEYGNVSTSVDRAQDEPDEKAALVPVWECSNCFYRKPRVRREAPAADHRTPAQQRWLERIATDFGGTMTVEHHGRSLWVSAKNPERHAGFDGTICYGTIGALGKVKLTIPRYAYGDVTITDVRDWHENAPVKAIRDARRDAEIARLHEWIARDEQRAEQRAASRPSAAPEEKE